MTDQIEKTLDAWEKNGKRRVKEPAEFNRQEGDRVTVVGSSTVWEVEGKGRAWNENGVRVQYVYLKSTEDRVEESDVQTTRFLHRAQGQPAFREGHLVLAAYDENDGDDAVTYTRPNGRVSTVLRVVGAQSLSDYMVEELDAWSHQHSAECVLATEEEARELIEEMTAADERRVAEEAKKQAEVEAYAAAVAEAKTLGGKCTAPIKAVAGYTRVGEMLWDNHAPSGYNNLQRIRFDDGREGALHSYGNASVAYVPDDIAKAARLAWAKEMGITPQKAAKSLEKYSQCHGADVWREVVDAADDADFVADVERIAEAQEVLKQVQEVHQIVSTIYVGHRGERIDTDFEDVEGVEYIFPDDSGWAKGVFRVDENDVYQRMGSHTCVVKNDTELARRVEDLHRRLITLVPEFFERHEKRVREEQEQAEADEQQKNEEVVEGHRKLDELLDAVKPDGTGVAEIEEFLRSMIKYEAKKELSARIAEELAEMQFTERYVTRHYVSISEQSARRLAEIDGTPWEAVKHDSDVHVVHRGRSRAVWSDRAISKQVGLPGWINATMLEDGASRVFNDVDHVPGWLYRILESADPDSFERKTIERIGKSSVERVSCNVKGDLVQFALTISVGFDDVSVMPTRNVSEATSTFRDWFR